MAENNDKFMYSIIELINTYEKITQSFDHADMLRALYVLDNKSSGELFEKLPEYVKNKELYIKENDNGMWLIWSCEEKIWEDYIDEFVYYRRYEGVRLETGEYFNDDELCEYVMPNWCKCVKGGYAYGYDGYLISFY